MTMKVESPEERPPYRFTVEEAEAFFASWYRVAEPDGSTVAYAPDRVTACMIADRTFQYRELAKAAQRVCEELREHGRVKTNSWLELAALVKEKTDG